MRATPGLSNRLQDARLGHPAEEGVHGRLPAGGHVELDRVGQLIGMGERSWPPVPGFADGVDREAHHVGEQSGAAVTVPVAQCVPELGRVLWPGLRPALMPGPDRLARDAIIQPWRLGAEADGLQVQLEATVRAVVIEDLERQGMECRTEGTSGCSPRACRRPSVRCAVNSVISRSEMAEGPSSSSGSVVASPPLPFASSTSSPAGAPSPVASPSEASASGSTDTSSSGPDITTIDAQAAVACDADEDARTGDFLGIEGERRSSKASSAVSSSPSRSSTSSGSSSAPSCSSTRRSKSALIASGIEARREKIGEVVS